MAVKKLIFVFVLTAFSQVCFASKEPGPRFDVKTTKTNAYKTEGFFAGGQRSVTAVKLKDVRHSSNKGSFERIVFDLEPMVEDTVKMPFFQVQLSPDEGRMVLSIWADVQYDFNAKKTEKLFSKSPHFKKMNIVPRVEDGLATVEFLINTAKNKKPKVEVFQLAQPPRIIIDVL